MHASPRYPDYLAYRIKRLYLLASQFVEHALKPHGIGRSQWQVLSRLKPNGGLSQRELQTLLQVEPATLTGIVDSLVAKGWVERLENPEDKRGKLVQLTAEGAARVGAISEPVDALEARMLHGISAEERRLVEGVLGRMISNLEAGRPA